MKNVFVELEKTDGTGLIHCIETKDEVPTYVRWYAPFSEEASSMLYLSLMENPVTYRWMMEGANLISIYASTAYETYPSVVGLKTEAAKEKVVSGGKVPRVIKEDGKSFVVTMDLSANRVNLWVSHDHVYRAEIF